MKAILKMKLTYLLFIFIFSSCTIFAQQNKVLKVSDYKISIDIPEEYNFFEKPDESTDFMWIKSSPSIGLSVNYTDLDFEVADNKVVALLSSDTMRKLFEEKVNGYLTDTEILSFKVDKFFSNKYSARMVCLGNGKKVGLDGPVLYIGYITWHKKSTIHFEALFMGETPAVTKRNECLNELNSIINSIKFI